MLEKKSYSFVCQGKHFYPNQIAHTAPQKVKWSAPKQVTFQGLLLETFIYTLRTPIYVDNIYTYTYLLNKYNFF